MTRSPGLLRCGFLADADLGQLVARLRTAGIPKTQDKSTGDLRELDFAPSPRFPHTTLRISVSSQFDDYGVMFLSGQHRLDLASDLSKHAQLLPDVLVHSMAREGGDAGTRVLGLRQLGLLAMDPESGSAWSDVVDATLRAAAADPERDVRKEAAFSAVLIGRDQAARLAAWMAVREQEPDLRSILLELAGESAESAAPEAKPTALRLAMPFHVPGSPENLLKAFAGDVTSRELTPVTATEVLRRVVITMDPLAASMLLVFNAPRRVGCAYFTGVDRTELALSSIEGMQFLPAELCRWVSLEATDTEERLTALAAIGLLCSATAGGPDPESTEALQALSTDADERIRSYAMELGSLRGVDLGRDA
jgi:hypothetical protein